jgi:hypothetical protein
VETVRVQSGVVTRDVTVQVVGATITGTVVPAVVAPGTQGRVMFRLLDQAGNPMSSQEVRVSATGLSPETATGVTTSNGDFEFAFTAPATTGSYSVSATAGGATLTPPSLVQVQTAGAVQAASAVVASASVSANPSVVGVNQTGSTANRTDIRALFLGANNLPVKNVRVKFDLSGDLNSIGGTFASGDATLYSDANGVVSTAYIPGSRSSPTDGVTIRACYGSTDTDPNFTSCGTFSTVKLTVTAEPLGVSIGTNEFVLVDELTYSKKFLVSVVDSAGVAKPDVNITASVDLKNFIKGFYTVSASAWRRNTQAICPNEDVNRNGVAESGEDLDLDGRLEPGKSDVTVSILHPRTRADGTAEILVRYAKSFATWIDAEITVAASGVSGTEGRASYALLPLPAVASAFTTTDSSPAFQISPYGFEPGCNVRD